MHYTPTSTKKNQHVNRSKTSTKFCYLNFHKFSEYTSKAQKGKPETKKIEQNFKKNYRATANERNFRKVKDQTDFFVDKKKPSPGEKGPQCRVENPTPAGPFASARASPTCVTEARAQDLSLPAPRRRGVKVIFISKDSRTEARGNTIFAWPAFLLRCSVFSLFFARASAYSDGPRGCDFSSGVLLRIYGCKFMGGFVVLRYFLRRKKNLIGEMRAFFFRGILQGGSGE